MSAVAFLLALAALSAGTYAMRFAGVKIGAAVAIRGKRGAARTAASANKGSGTDGASAQEGAAVDGSAAPAGEGAEPGAASSRLTRWMDRAMVVLIAAVCATTALFDGKDLADPARLIGVGAGVVAAILRVPMLLCVIVGMGVCALIRTTGVL